MARGSARARDEAVARTRLDEELGGCDRPGCSRKAVYRTDGVAANPVQYCEDDLPEQYWPLYRARLEEHDAAPKNPAAEPGS